MTQRRLLVVEDNALNAKLLRDLLGYNGYAVLEADTAERGLELAQQHQPDLILMDIHLPGMDGREALRHLKADARTANIPVIAVTASLMPEESAQILAAGFDGFQGKPISVTSLLEQISKLVPKE